MSSPNSAPLSGAAVSSVPVTPPARPRSPRTWYFLGTTLFGVGVYAVEMIAQLATFIALFIWNGLLPIAEPEQLRALMREGGWLGLSAIVACPFVLGALWVPIRIARQNFSDYLGLRWPDRREVFSGLAMLAALIVAWILVRLAAGQPIPTFTTETYRSATTDGPMVAYVIGFCVAAPIAEELLVRGFLFRGWSQSFLGPAGAIVLTSVAWAALHTQYNLFYMAHIFTLGILLGYLRHRSGSTWLTVILHAAHNVVSIAQVALIIG